MAQTQYWDNNDENDNHNLNNDDNIDNIDNIVNIDKDDIINNLEENNGTLLISEVQGKVVLPYTIKEVDTILNNNREKYSSRQEVIENVFTKPFNDYKNQFSSRFREAVELVTKRDKMSFKDGISLVTELFSKRYLHPAIISACKNVDELNVYIDCLDNNELDDFKIFNIEYEIYPMVENNNNSLYIKTGIFQKTLNFIKKLFRKKDDYSKKNEFT